MSETQKTILIKYDPEVKKTLKQEGINFKTVDFLELPEVVTEEKSTSFKKIELQINESLYISLRSMSKVSGIKIDTLINAALSEYVKIMKEEPLSCLEDLFGNTNVVEVFERIILNTKKEENETNPPG